MLKVWILTLIVTSWGDGDVEIVNYNYPSRTDCLESAQYYKREISKSSGVRSVGTACKVGYVSK